ncbi:MAG: DinB family protein [Bacteroidota bacterium]|nr:DinB family protein [Ferruginibacter sp.]
MKEILQQHTSYNLWAHQRMFETMRQLSTDQVHFVIPSSFSSIYKTVLHLLDAESIWWQRLKLVEHIESPGKTFNGSFTELESKLIQQSKEWDEWVHNANELQLSHVFAYQNTRKEQFKQSVNEVLLHLVNHSTYHRGQLVTMLHQLGIERIMATDFNVFARSAKR